MGKGKDYSLGRVHFLYLIYYEQLKKKNFVACVRERTIPAKRLLLVGQGSINFCG
jgi:hypothetical protein